MKPILIDVTRLIFRVLKGKRATGVDRVSLAYVAHFAERSRAVLSWRGRVVVLSQARSAQVFRELLSDQVLQRKTFWYWVLCRDLIFALSSGWQSGAFLFNTGQKGLESSAYAFRLKQMGVAPIFFIHDLIPLTHPEYCRPNEAGKHQQRMFRALEMGYALIVNSADTAYELERFAQTHQMELPQLQVAWLAAGIEAEIEGDANRTNIRGVGLPPAHLPYFVMLGTIEPRKNHIMILQVWRRLVEQMGRDAPQLWLVGQRGWECEQVVDLLERCPALQQHVVEVPSASDEQLKDILKHARALLFPSFAEGYGMPLVEALCLGVPVIASDIPVFREIGQGIPDLLDPIAGEKWFNIVVDYQHLNSTTRAEQLQRMQEYQPWEWHNHFAVVDALLEDLSSHESQ